MIHTLAESLDVSHRYADAPWWEEVYREAFPGVAAIVDTRQQGWHQRAGIDRALTLADSKQVLIDEKVREQDYDDFFLEFWSVRERREPGWVAKDLACDYIAYAFVPSGRCFLLPFRELRRAWRTNHRAWVRDYHDPGKHRIPNYSNGGGQYHTWGACVPIDEVLNALRESLLVHFTPEDQF